MVVLLWISVWELNMKQNGLIMKFLISIFLLLCLFSCSNEKSILSEIEKVIEINPDSAYFLLADIDTSKFNLEEINYFRLLEIMSKDKSDRDISNDQIHDLKKYYKLIGDFDKVALSLFYSGRVYQENSNDKEALKSYYSIQLLEDKLSDKEIIGKSLINSGTINYNQELYQEAINDFKNSLTYLSISNKYYPSILLSVGNGYLLSFYYKDDRSLYDSAQYYYKKALDISKKSNNNMCLNIIQDIGMSHYIIEDYPTALNYYNDALSLTTDSISTSRLYLNLCWVYLEKEEWELITKYIKVAQSILSNHPDEMVYLYYFLYCLNDRKGDQEKATEYYRQYTTSLIEVKEKSKDASLMEIRKKYKEQILRVNIEKQRLRYSLVITIIIGIIVLIVAFFVRMIRKKNLVISDVYRKVKYYEKLSEKHIETLEIKESDENQYRAILNDYLGILKDVVLYENILRKEDKNKAISKIYKIVYDDEDFNWEKLYNALYILNKRLFDKLMVIFNQTKELDDLDFKICCLSISEFSQNEISVILKESLRKVQRKITNIRAILCIEKGNPIRKHIEQLQNNSATSIS